jgi:hypothetical protein
VLAGDIARIAAARRAPPTAFCDFASQRRDGSRAAHRGRSVRIGPACLFGPETERPKIAFDRILIAWNGSREAARALGEACPICARRRRSWSWSWS